MVGRATVIVGMIVGGGEVSGAPRGLGSSASPDPDGMEAGQRSAVVHNRGGGLIVFLF